MGGRQQESREHNNILVRHVSGRKNAEEKRLGEQRRWSGCQGERERERVMEMGSERTNQNGGGGGALLTRGQSGV